MACKCTQTTSNATGGGSITSALSACTYPLWIRHLSGCTSDLDVHFGNPGANILFNIGQANQDRPYGVDNIGINKTDPMHTFSLSGTIDVHDYMHFEDSGYGSKVNPAHGTSVYLGYGAGSTRANNPGNSSNVAIGAYSIGSVGVMANAQNNVAVGFSTGMNLNSGDDNVIIGTQAGVSLNSGSRNTFLGNRTATEITTQTGNVYLGYGQGAAATESDSLRIGNQLQTPGGTARPLIQGNFAESGATIWGDLRITDTPRQLDIAFLGVDADGYVKETKAILGPGVPAVEQPIGFFNTGVWTANTRDAGGGYMGELGYRSVSISGGTNADNSPTEYFGTRVGIGTESPTVPFHVKGKYSYAYVQSVGGGSSYIASVTDQSIAYMGVAAGSGVQSGSTTWRMKAFTSDISMPNWANDTPGNIGTGFSIMRASRSVVADPSTQSVVNPFSILGDTEHLGSAIVIRGDANIGGGGRNHGVGIFTPAPNTELTVVGAMSASGAIHSTDYIKFPLIAQSTYVGYQSGSGTTVDANNTGFGYRTLSSLNGSTAAGNVAVGSGALQSITTGDSNIGIGYNSATLSVSTDDNIAIGGRSLSNAISSSKNIAIGSDALLLNTDSFNTAIGHNVYVTKTSGSKNVAIGEGSGGGGGVNAGHFNTLVGGQSGISFQGKGLVAVGYGSMTGSSSSNDIICIGYNTQPTLLGVDFSMNIGNLIYGGTRPTDSTAGRKVTGINVPSPITALDVMYGGVTALPEDRGGGNHIVTFGTAGAGYAAHKLVQLRGAANWVPADADDITLQGNLIGIAMGAEPENGILLKGYYNVTTADDITTWANGGPVYVSTTGGKITESIASFGPGDYVRIVGYMTTTANVIYFNPDNTFIVL